MIIILVFRNRLLGKTLDIDQQRRTLFNKDQYVFCVRGEHVHMTTSYVLVGHNFPHQICKVDKVDGDRNNELNLSISDFEIWHNYFLLSHRFCLRKVFLGNGF